MKQPPKRKLHPNSAANLNQSVAGMRSVTARIYAQEIVARWFEKMTSSERGQFLQRAKPKK